MSMACAPSEAIVDVATGTIGSPDCGHRWLRETVDNRPHVDDGFDKLPGCATRTSPEVGLTCGSTDSWDVLLRGSPALVHARLPEDVGFRLAAAEVEDGAAS
jgi:hypothetical protein